MKVINKINDDLIEIREYAKPNACFQTNEYPDNYDFCILKEQFNPFDLFNDNKIKDKEIERLTVESTEWESKCYKYQDIIDKLEKLLKQDLENENHIFYSNITIKDYIKCILDKLKELEEGKE